MGRDRGTNSGLAVKHVSLSRRRVDQVFVGIVEVRLFSLTRTSTLLTRCVVIQKGLLTKW